MSLSNCGGRCARCSCTCLAVILSVAVGVITAFLTIMGTVALTPAFLWVTLGIAAVYLLGNLVASALAAEYSLCCCPALTAILVGILGTLIFSVVLLAITFPATSVLGAIFTGVLLFFLFLIFFSTACYVRCLSRCE